MRREKVPSGGGNWGPTCFDRPPLLLPSSVRDPHPPTQRLLYSFDDDLTPWTVTTDAAHGGASEARLTRRGDGGGAEFAGTLAPGAGLRGAFASMTAQVCVSGLG